MWRFLWTKKRGMLKLFCCSSVSWQTARVCGYMVLNRHVLQPNGTKSYYHSCFCRLLLLLLTVDWFLLLLLLLRFFFFCFFLFFFSLVGTIPRKYIPVVLYFVRVSTISKRRSGASWVDIGNLAEPPDMLSSCTVGRGWRGFGGEESFGWQEHDDESWQTNIILHYFFIRDDDGVRVWERTYYYCIPYEDCTQIMIP